MNEDERYSLVEPDVFDGKKIRVELLGETPDTVVKTYTLDSLKDVKLYLAVKDSRHIQQTMFPRKSNIYEKKVWMEKGDKGLAEYYKNLCCYRDTIEEEIDYEDYDFVEYVGEKNGEILNTIRDSIYHWCRNGIQCFFPRIYMIGKMNKDEIKKSEEVSVAEISALITQLNSLLEEEDCIMPVISLEDVKGAIS